jgi:beta-phosphoglucomutase-like phosphatase (HAD superfamily)
MTIKAIIFDADGTLAKTENIHRLAFNATFREFNLDWEWSIKDYIRLLAISGGKERIRTCLESDPVTCGLIDNPRLFAQRIHQRKTEIYKDMLNSSHITLRSGIERLFNEAISKGIKLAIATSSSLSNIETLLVNTLGHESILWFDAIVTCDVVNDKKPSPMAYQLALARLGLKPEYCIAIEDTTNGNLSALAAGLKTIITTHEFTIDSDFIGASLVLDQLGEPENSFTVISGNAFGQQYVDMELLDAILTANQTRHEMDYWENNLVAAAK